MKKFIILFISFFFSTSMSYADTRTLTTYYPSPFGLYTKVRLYPANFDSTAACQIGTMRVDAAGRMWLCSDDGAGSGTWGDGSSVGRWEEDGNNIYPASTAAKPDLMIGIGTKTPEFKLDINTDGGIIGKGTFGNGNFLTTAGAGTRLMWYPRKAAFRSGFVSGAEWDDVNIGDYSAAFGNTIIASGNSSTAMGRGTIASGIASTSTGYFTKAESYASTAIGQFNVGGGNPAAWNAADPLFEIGYGVDDANRNNAFTVFKDGNVFFDGDVGIGETNPQTVLHLKTSDNTPLLKLTSNESAELILEPQNTPAYVFNVLAYNGGFWIDSAAGAGLVFFIKGSNGNIGIGTNTPGSKLEVAGNIYSNSVSSKLIMKSPDGTCTACGPDNADAWVCAAIACP